jgi:putative membrane protein
MMPPKEAPLMKVLVLSAVALCSLVLPANASFAQADPMAQVPGQNQGNEPGRPTAPNSSLMDSSGAPNETPQQIKDKMFIHEAIEGGLAEIALGSLAAQKSTNDDVRAFGKRMVEDHTKLNQQLAHVADIIGARAPKKMGKDQQAQYDKLAALSGDDFDREYITLMVKDHHKDLREMRMEARTTQDADLKALLGDGAPTIRDHMVSADRMAHERGIPMPGHHHHSSEPGTSAPPSPPQ